MYDDNPGDSLTTQESAYAALELLRELTINYENAIARGDLESFEWYARRLPAAQDNARFWSLAYQSEV